MREQRCAICGEGELTYNPWAEMVDPSAPEGEGGVVVHAECGIARGWEVA